MKSPSRLGFGVSGPLGQQWFSEEKAVALIEAAYNGGVRHFDTAPFYGAAQERLGFALAALNADDAFVSTKTGTRRESGGLVKDFSERAIRQDVETSLNALQRSKLDLLYLHGPSVEQVDASRPVLEKLKTEGLADAIGICGDGAPVARAIDSGFDAAMMIYNLLDRRNETLFVEAKTRGLKTVAIGTLVQGLVDPAFAAPGSLSDLWRLARAILRGRYDRASTLMARRALGSIDPAGKALTFVLAHPAIDVVMTTTTKERHLESSLAVAVRPPDPGLHESLTNALLTGEAAAPS